jgi:D-alanyl-D-alanine carboxypeptidase
LEELIYWGIIFLFYLFSAYRSRQKKVEAKEFQAPEHLPQTENKNSKTDLNIFEFLDEAMEKSAVVLDDSLTTNFVEPSNDELLIQQNSKKSIQPDYSAENDLNQSFNIKDKHLSHLKARITTKGNSSHSEQKLLTLQQKLKNKPTKLAIVMQAIFDPPKSQGI